MTRAALFLIIFVASAAFAQNCTTYVVVDPFDGKTTKGIDNLQAQNFVAKSGRLALPVISARQDFNNRVLVLLQAGGRTPQKQAQVREIADLVRKAPSGRQIAFGMFAETTFISSDFFSDPEKRAAAVDEILAQGAQLRGRHMALYDSLHQALVVFGPHQPGDTILLLTESDDSHSKHKNIDELTNEFVASGTRIMVMTQTTLKGSVEEYLMTPLPHFLRLALLIQRTGGILTRYNFEGLMEFARAGYMLGIEIPATWNKPKEWHLMLKDPSGGVDQKAFLFFPWKLTPCGSLTASAH